MYFTGMGHSSEYRPARLQVRLLGWLRHLCGVHGCHRPLLRLLLTHRPRLATELLLRRL